MLISGFGDTYAGATIFPINLTEDDWTLQRPAAARRVPWAGGAYDFKGAERDVLAAYTVRKKFTAIGDLIWVKGPGTVYTFALGHGDILGIGTDFKAFGTDRIYIRFTYSGTTYTYPARDVASEADIYLYLEDAASTPLITSENAVDYEIAVAEPFLMVGDALETLKRGTLARGESKLWLDMRDGSHRWAWAKCSAFSVSERFDTAMAVPVELEFYLREGIWYSETLHTETVSGSSGDVTLVNAGNIATPVKSTVHAGSAAITMALVKPSGIPYLWQFAGTLAAGKDLLVDSARWSAINDGAGCYADLLTNYPTEPWFLLEPGSTTLTLQWTGGGTDDTFKVEWYDAWV